MARYIDRLFMCLFIHLKVQKENNEYNMGSGLIMVLSCFIHLVVGSIAQNRILMNLNDLIRNTTESQVNSQLYTRTF